MPPYRTQLQRALTSGITWLDPREPPPPELVNDGVQSSSGHRGALAIENNGFGRQQLAHHVRSPPTNGHPRFTIREPDRNVLPPLSVEAEISIVQDTAKVAVTQHFWNDSDAPLREAAFTFPLPADCTVTDFSCRIGTKKIIRGAVMPREEARESFDRHLRNSDRAAALLNQETPEIFTTTLGNVPEKTKVRIDITYITLLKHRFVKSRNLTTLTIPPRTSRRDTERRQKGVSASPPQRLISVRG
ncbi:hypothetical protein VTH82DRAFT_5337 [Thermothelomyces myriococcoides]